jgi:hypothetical protein
MVPDTSKPCATCGKQRTMSCEACSCVQYCGQVCLNQNLHEHREKCESILEELLERIGETLQQVLYVFSKRIYTLPVSSMCKELDAVMILEGLRDLQTMCQVLFPFPTQLTTSLDLRDIQAILSTGRSVYQIAYLHDFVAQRMKGLAD